jgi:UDP-N-acetyl-D-galactosamine dehydrogenase
MLLKHIHPVGAKILVMGLTFKENCPDIRNTKVTDIIAELKSFRMEVDVYDPWADAKEAHEEYGLHTVAEPETGNYDAVVIAVAHRQFRKLGADGIRAFGKPGAVVYDIKYVLGAGECDDRL